MHTYKGYISAWIDAQLNLKEIRKPWQPNLNIRLYLLHPKGPPLYSSIKWNPAQTCPKFTLRIHLRHWYLRWYHYFGKHCRCSNSLPKDTSLTLCENHHQYQFFVWIWIYDSIQLTFSGSIQLRIFESIWLTFSASIWLSFPNFIWTPLHEFNFKLKSHNSSQISVTPHGVPHSIYWP